MEDIPNMDESSSSRHAKKQRHHAAHESRATSSASGLSATFLVGVIIALGVLIVVSAYIIGYQYGKMSLGPSASGAQAAAPAAAAAPSAAQQPAAAKPAAQAVAPPPSVPKQEKPSVELFIMSYCPYGLQMQKAYVPVAKLLGSKADMRVKWVSYIMHGDKEAEENLRQHCIQQEQMDKYLEYATCFVASTDTAKCQDQAKIDKAKLQACYAAADTQYSVTASLKDQSSWLSGRFPQFNVDKTATTQYSVQGSPTLIINGKSVSIARSAEAIKQAVCNSFTTPPAECQTALNTNQEAPGAGPIGVGSGAGAPAAAACG